jgi:hypothetical protein
VKIQIKIGKISKKTFKKHLKARRKEKLKIKLKEGYEKNKNVVNAKKRNIYSNIYKIYQS